jgi:hypothetical protein
LNRHISRFCVEKRTQDINPALLHDAQPLANFTIKGDQLTITSSSEFSSKFQIVVSATDGVDIVDQRFTVIVALSVKPTSTGIRQTGEF